MKTTSLPSPSTSKSSRTHQCNQRSQLAVIGQHNGFSSSSAPEVNMEGKGDPPKNRFRVDRIALRRLDGANMPLGHAETWYSYPRIVKQVTSFIVLYQMYSESFPAHFGLELEKLCIKIENHKSNCWSDVPKSIAILIKISPDSVIMVSDTPNASKRLIRITLFTKMVGISAVRTPFFQVWFWGQLK